MSKHKSGIHLVGKVFGEDLGIKSYLRNSTFDNAVPNSMLLYGSNQLEIDTQRMAGRLYRLLPSGYMVAKADDWKPFIRMAIAMRLL